MRNTLSRQHTACLFPDPAACTALCAHWSAHHREMHRAAHHLLYLALCGKDWRSAFTRPRNAVTVENGGFYNWSLFHALRALQSAAHYPSQGASLLEPFGGTVTPAHLAAIVTVLPSVQDVLDAFPQQERYQVPAHDPVTGAVAPLPFPAYACEPAGPLVTAASAEPVYA